MRDIAAVAALTIALAVAGAAYAGRPTAPPPKVPGVAAAPPPAWAESGSRSTWAVFGSYCWKTVCADMLPPAGRPDLPVLRAARGALVRLHLGFAPRSAMLTVGGSKPVVLHPKGTVLTWRARAGIADIAVKAAGGSASYLVRIR